jgi:membrane protein
VSRLRTAFEVLVIAYNRFVLHDAWAIASHIALSILMSMFPFLILVTALASMFGTGSLADEAADIILEAWPSEVAKPIADEVHSILTVRREGVLTLGLVLALYFASSGVEALRVGLNRAYGLRETRAWWFTRLESIAFVIGGAFVMLAFALLVVLGPLVWRGALYWLPGLRPFGNLIDFLRIGVATLLIVLALVMAHKLVPAGQRNFRSVLPGVGVTLALWILGGLGFGWYLENYPGAYASTYGGLATAMAALVFLYTLAAIFLFGGELNGTVIAAKRRRLHKIAEARHFENVVKAP